MAAKKRDTGSGGEYVAKVRENTQKYVKDLLAENEKLRALVRELEGEVDRHRKDRSELEGKLAVLEAEAKRYYEQYVNVEMQNANVANLYVASFRLHGTIDRAEVLTAIKEIVINLIGSEELAIYELDPSGQHLVVVESFGLGGERLGPVRIGDGIIGRAAQSGEPWVVSPAGEGSATPTERPGAAPYERHLTACIPLRVDGKVTGAIAIHRLLGHKRALEDVDRELFGLLGTQAATALYCTKLAMRA